MLRLLQAIRSRRNRRELEQNGTPSPEPQRRTSDPRISYEMAFKLFGEPEPTPTPLVVPEPVQAAEPMLSPDARFRAELTPPPTPDPFGEVRRAAEEELRFRALLEATTGPMRRELAQAVPELESPLPYLSELENEVFRLVYVKGMPFTAVAQRHKLSTAKAKRMARVALYYVAFYAKHPERADERVEFLNAQKNKVLERLYWQGLSYKEATKELGRASTLQYRSRDSSRVRLRSWRIICGTSRCRITKASSSYMSLLIKQYNPLAREHHKTSSFSLPGLLPIG